MICLTICLKEVHGAWCFNKSSVVYISHYSIVQNITALLTTQYNPNIEHVYMKITSANILLDILRTIDDSIW